MEDSEPLRCMLVPERDYQKLRHSMRIKGRPQTAAAAAAAHTPSCCCCVRGCIAGTGDLGQQQQKLMQTPRRPRAAPWRIDSRRYDDAGAEEEEQQQAAADDLLLQQQAAVIEVCVSGGEGSRRLVAGAMALRLMHARAITQPK